MVIHTPMRHFRIPAVYSIFLCSTKANSQVDNILGFVKAHREMSKLARIPSNELDFQGILESIRNNDPRVSNVDVSKHAY
jgi:hypothetical protein